MKTFYITTVFFVALLSVACGDDSNGSENREEDNSVEDNGLAIRLVNTGAEDLDVQMDSSGAYSVFCYEDTGCEEFFDSGFFVVYEGQSMIAEHSDPEGQAVGVKVGFEVLEGSGYAEIIAGRAYDDDGWREFDEGDVVHTSEAFEKGDIVTFDYGDVD